ncbi:MAG: hypothetical protein FRX49_11007 [Trebouxia sp. A1-2]|nr:MAG: hypothetical protein FRX49_11007 [Trebouxia sp. A1-2]
MTRDEDTGTGTQCAEAEFHAVYKEQAAALELVDLNAQTESAKQRRGETIAEATLRNVQHSQESSQAVCLSIRTAREYNTSKTATTAQLQALTPAEPIVASSHRKKAVFWREAVLWRVKHSGAGSQVVVLQRRAVVVGDGQGVCSLNEEVIVEASMLVVMHCGRPVGVKVVCNELSCMQ